MFLKIATVLAILGLLMSFCCRLSSKSDGRPFLQLGYVALLQNSDR